MVGRTENIVTPVEGDDIFPILHRRLFTTIGPARNGARSPTPTRTGTSPWPMPFLPATGRPATGSGWPLAFPFHPELVDILTNRWGSLSGFQRTRGALRTLAHTVKALSQRQQQGAADPSRRRDARRPGHPRRGPSFRRGELQVRAERRHHPSGLDGPGGGQAARRPGRELRPGHGAGDDRVPELVRLRPGPGRLSRADAARGRPAGLSRGLIEDVRDALEASLWYMRLEGGRYRFTTEPNLNKVVLEREGAISDDRIETLLHDAISNVAPTPRSFGLNPGSGLQPTCRTASSSILGILDLDLRVNGDVTGETLRVAREILEHCGGSWRANKNAAMLIAADIAGMSQGQGHGPHPRRAAGTERRQAPPCSVQRRAARPTRQAPDGRRGTPPPAGHDGLPAPASARRKQHRGRKARPHRPRPSQAQQHDSRSRPGLPALADRIIETTLAPAALLSARFGLLPDGTNVAELEALLGFFYRLPSLPKLANSGVLRRALAEGVEKGLFGLASGSAWDAEDAVLRFSQSIDPTEIQFQPGTWLVRAAAIRELIAKRQPPPKPEPPAPSGQGSPGGESNTQPDQGGSSAGPTQKPEPPKPANPVGPIPGVAIHLTGVPASKMRDIIRVAVIPLSQASTDVTIELNIHADGGIAGIPRETLNLVVLEGLRQLGFPNVDVDIEENH